MDCPVCKNAMITLELSDVEIDYCTGCRGIWLDAGELETLLDDRKITEKLIESFRIDKSCKENTRKCPICLKKMHKIIAGTSTSAPLIDKCDKDHGLWFDRGELKNIFETAQLDETSKIQKLLAEMFGTENTNNQNQ
ncbi:MAG: hypothetical protein E4H45_03005 [Nitrospirales bacterium]|nr:MAG: hypothetical protein E4H45_03005 [Nitrospirales bacterium]